MLLLVIFLIGEIEMATDFNMVRVLKERMGDEVKKAVTEQLVKDELREYEKKLRDKIKPLVEKISFKGIESMKDAMRMREELHVFLHWEGEDKPVTKEI